MISDDKIQEEIQSVRLSIANRDRTTYPQVKALDLLLEVQHLRKTLEKSEERREAAITVLRRHEWREDPTDHGLFRYCLECGCQHPDNPKLYYNLTDVSPIGHKPDCALAKETHP